MTKIDRGVRYPVSFQLNGEVVQGYAEECWPHIFTTTQGDSMTYKELLHKLKIVERNEPARLNNEVIIMDDQTEICQSVDDLYDVWDDQDDIKQVLLLLINVDNGDNDGQG